MAEGKCWDNGVGGWLVGCVMCNVYVLKHGLWEEALVQDGKGNVAVVCVGWKVGEFKERRMNEGMKMWRRVYCEM